MNSFFNRTNKSLLIIAIMSLLIRVGNFYNTFVPKPFEILFVALCLFTIVHILKNKKIKEFFTPIPKNILIAVSFLMVSVIGGWLVSLFVSHVTSTLNMVLEFGTFTIGLTMFLLVLFYSYNDKKYARLYLYALLLPTVYSIFSIFPSITPSFLLAEDGNFIGLTPNVNIVSKVLLVPAMFFMAHALLTFKGIKIRALYIAISTAIVALLIWISSRGALLSLSVGMFSLWLVATRHQFSWNKLFLNTLVITVIIVAGFALTPYSRKQVVLNRVLNSDAQQFSQLEVKKKSLGSIIRDSVHRTSIIEERANSNIKLKETRLQIWPFYLNNQILNHPFGIGPNTHIESNILNTNGDYVSTGPHNTYLQIWLWGGLVGIISYLYIIFYAFKNLKDRLSKNFSITTVSILVIMITLAVSIMFDDSLSFYNFWIILALAIRE
ncbi:MAG: O-antigen ligase family protein [Patescibacteria group bacterium]